jgi:hypothetical protein
MVKQIVPFPKPVVPEVGVAIGDFSEFIIQEIKPSKFVAIDTFEMEKHPIHWGVPQEVLLKGMTHLEFYKKRFEKYGEVIQIERGLSHERLAQMPDNSFDLIYIDAAHVYENVKTDGELAQRKLKSNGIIIFNDYVMYDPFVKAEYGVMQAVNEIVSNGGWKVKAFALEKYVL